MTRATLLRVLLAVTLLIATGVTEVRAQCITNVCPPPPPPPNTGPPPSVGPPLQTPGPPSDSHNNRVIWYVVGGVVIAVIGWVIANQPWADAGPPPPQPPLPPKLPPVAQL